MSKRKPYQKRPESNTRLKSQVLSKADFYEVDLIVEVRRTVRVKALNEEQATFFAENRVRKKSKGYAWRLNASIGDILFLSVRKESDGSTN